VIAEIYELLVSAEKEGLRYIYQLGIVQPEEWTNNLA
jgi:hypothetical protein